MGNQDNQQMMGGNQMGAGFGQPTAQQNTGGGQNPFDMFGGDYN